MAFFVILMSMKLGYHTEGFANFSVVRDLSDTELELHKNFSRIFVEARNRLSLFRILATNYAEWCNYLRALLSPQEQREDEGLELDRLLLNYLTAAYTIREHFEVSFNRRYRKDLEKQKDYSDFLSRVYAGNWAFAFFLDFRDYVQHRGLGIGQYHKTVSATSIELCITVDSAQLVAGSREWKRSKLQESRGVLDLVPLLRDFHDQMMGGYASFVVRTFYPELVPASEFYQMLRVEVQKVHATARMVLVAKLVTEEIEGRTHGSFSLVCVPNDVFGELGINLVAANTKTSSPA